MISSSMNFNGGSTAGKGFNNIGKPKRRVSQEPKVVKGKGKDLIPEDSRVLQDLEIDKD
jgi:hypothetical protein